jgi:hypothetical protein
MVIGNVRHACSASYSGGVSGYFSSTPNLPLTQAHSNGSSKRPHDEGSAFSVRDNGNRDPRSGRWPKASMMWERRDRLQPVACDHVNGTLPASAPQTPDLT